MNPAASFRSRSRRSRTGAWIAFACLVVASASSSRADAFLDPDEAFALTTRAVDARHVALRFAVAPGYHLYRDRFAATLQPGELAEGALALPRGTVEHDPLLDRDVEVFREPVELVLALPERAGSYQLVVVDQGCADRGLCYPPTEHAFRVDVGGASPRLTPIAEADVSPRSGDERNATAIERAFASKSLLRTAGVFLLAGLLLSLTPCVLPMIPILSSIIVSSAEHVSRRRGLALAASYSLGMALVYTGMGMAAGLAGEGLAASLQNEWVLGAFALVLAALALSMFGAYELQLPGALQGRLGSAANRLPGGRFAGVFAMGAVSALVVGPCVAAPLAGALVYIGHTRDVVLGGVALFALAAGMSVPLLLVGASAGALLPRAGAWMERVRHGFGVALLGVALWIAAPVLPATATTILVAALLLATAVYLRAFDRIEGAITPLRALAKGSGLLLAVVAASQLLALVPAAHAALGIGADPSRGRATVAGNEPAGPDVATVRDEAALDALVRASPLPVVVDLRADWCVACRELEESTFADPAVRERLQAMTLVRFDVTANTADAKALMRRYALFGPPAVLFFAPSGGEHSGERLIGFEDARGFAARLDRVRQATSVAAPAAATSRRPYPG